MRLVLLCMVALAAVSVAGAAVQVPAACKASWRATAFPLVKDGSINGIDSVSSRDVWAVGDTPDDRGLTAHWDGTRWRRVPTPLGEISLNDVAAIARDDVWAVGYSGSPVILHWQGKSWRRISVPGLAEGSLFGVGGSAPDDVWAVGVSNFRSLILHWNGRAWRRVPAPTQPGLTENGGAIYPFRLYGVAALSKQDAWIVGEGLGETGQLDKLPLVEHWDGRAWSLVETPEVDGILESVSVVSPTDIWAAGDIFVNRSSFADRLSVVLHWDGADWQVRTLPFYVPGDVAAAGPRDVWVASSPLAHWDGSAWKRVRQPDTWLLYGGVEAVSARDVWAAGLLGYPARPSGPLAVHYSCAAR